MDRHTNDRGQTNRALAPRGGDGLDRGWGPRRLALPVLGIGALFACLNAILPAPHEVDSFPPRTPPAVVAEAEASTQSPAPSGAPSGAPARRATPPPPIRSWPATVGLTDHGPLDVAGRTQIEAQILPALRATETRDRELDELLRAGAYSELVIEASRASNMVVAARLYAQLHSLESGAYWTLDPGTCYAHNTALYRSYPDHWFVYMGPVHSAGRVVQAVLYISLSDHPEIPKLRRRASLLDDQLQSGPQGPGKIR